MENGNVIDNESTWFEDDFVLDTEESKNSNENDFQNEEEEVSGLNYAALISAHGYNPEEFLNDEQIESEEDIFAKLAFMNEQKKLEEIITDPELLEAIQLKREGKITSAKDWLNYVHKDTVEATTFEDEFKAKEFLINHYKSTGLSDKRIETLMISLETSDELLVEANSILQTKLANKEQEIAAKKEAYLKEQAAIKKQKEEQFANDFNAMNAYVNSSTWSNDLKFYVQQDIKDTIIDISEGKIENSKTLTNVFKALLNPKQAPKLIAYLSQMIVEDDVTVEPFQKQGESKNINKVITGWKKVQNEQRQKGTSQDFSNRKNDNLITTADI